MLISQKSCLFNVICIHSYTLVMSPKACSQYYGCFSMNRYGSQLMHKVLEMAEGIDVGEMPSYELVPNAEAKKRPHSSDGSKCFYPSTYRGIALMS